MRAVVDTNVLLSALLWGDTPHALLEHMRNGTVTLISSPALLAELTHVIERPKFDMILLLSNTSRAQTLAEVRQLAEVIDPPPLVQPVCRDPDDDAVLALAWRALCSTKLQVVGAYCAILDLKSPLLRPSAPRHRPTTRHSKYAATGTHGRRVSLAFVQQGGCIFTAHI